MSFKKYLVTCVVSFLFVEFQFIVFSFVQIKIGIDNSTALSVFRILWLESFLWLLMFSVLTSLYGLSYLKILILRFKKFFERSGK